MTDNRFGDIITDLAATTPKMKSQIANQLGFTTTQVGDLVAASL
ncbi:MAG: hypothetical protein WCK89_16590 [bacterium]